MTIYKGKNVDEAIEKGLAALNLKKNEVHINIIEKGQAGIFGFFEKEAEVDIIPLTEKELKLKKITPYWTAPPKLDRKNLTLGVFYYEINLWG